MSTRGAYGFRENNEDFIRFNRSDSYPAGLGFEVINLVYQKEYKGATEYTIRNDDDEEDYTSDYFENQKSFLINSLFCEYAYIMNLDTQKLEVYKGFNEEPGGAGRYANILHERENYDRSAYNDYTPPNYYGVTLFKEYTFQEIQEQGPDAILNDLEAAVEKFYDEEEDRLIAKDMADELEKERARNADYGISRLKFDTTI